MSSFSNDRQRPARALWYNSPTYQQLRYSALHTPLRFAQSTSVCCKYRRLRRIRAITLPRNWMFAAEPTSYSPVGPKKLLFMQNPAHDQRITCMNMQAEGRAAYTLTETNEYEPADCWTKRLVHGPRPPGPAFRPGCSGNCGSTLSRRTAAGSVEPSNSMLRITRKRSHDCCRMHTATH